MLETQPARAVGYTIGVAGTVLVALLFIGLRTILGPDVPLLLFIVPILAAAWYGGPGPGLLATALASLGGAYFFFFHPHDVLTPEQANDWLRIVLFAALGIALTGFCEIIRRAQRRAEARAREAAAAVADREVAEGRLRESEEHFRQLADSMPQIVFTARADGSTAYFNHRWYELTGCAPGSTDEATWLQVLHPDDRQRCLDTWYECVRTGKPYQIEYRFRFPGADDYRWHLGRALPVRDAAGNTVRWFGTCTDIDDQKRLEESLRESDRRKDDFLAVLAHELRNPLAAVRNAVEILGHCPGDASAVTQARAMMERQVGQLVRLVDDLLEVSRITRGKIKLVKQPVDLLSVVSLAVETSRPLIESRRHELTVKVPPVPMRVEGDPARLSQVLANLLNNAAKYTEVGGRVELTVESDGPEVRVRVRDSGVGIAPEMLPRVFDLFVQADDSPHRAQGGLGIGLTLARRLVEMHGGSIAARSDGVGKGSEFTVRLPLLPGAAAAPVPAERSASPTAIRATGRRVFIVDDNIDAAESLAVLLRLWNHEVHLAHDGLTAIEKVQAVRPDVVLLDIGLPKLDGYGVVRQLRERPDFNGMTLVAMTGYGQEEDRKKTRQAGFHKHLVKPVDLEAIQALLAPAG